MRMRVPISMRVRVVVWSMGRLGDGGRERVGSRGGGRKGGEGRMEGERIDLEEASEEMD